MVLSYQHFKAHLTTDTDFGVSSDEYTYKNACNELLPFFNFKQSLICCRSRRRETLI